MTAAPKAPAAKTTPAKKPSPTAAPAKTEAPAKTKAATAKKPDRKAAAAPAKEAPKPVALKDVKPADQARMYLRGRKGYWLGRLVSYDAKTMCFACSWHKKDNVKVDREDVARLEVRRGGKYVDVAL